MATPPTTHSLLEGSELLAAPGARRLGPASETDTLSVTIVLRRRPDGPPVPDHEHYRRTPPSRRRRLSEAAFAARYGSHPDEIDKVVAFARNHGLSVDERHPARHTVVVSGTVAGFNRAFGITLHIYEHEVERSRLSGPKTETYRGYEGFIHLPPDIGEVIVGVFGLDNRRITKRNLADPPATHPIPVTTAPKLYDFPPNLAAGQTIAIFSEGGYLASDIAANFGGGPPSVIDISVDASNGLFADAETTQDIFIAGSAAPGAQIAVYFTTYTQKGWVDLLTRVIHPQPGDPVCSVLSSSFYVSNGDDAATLLSEGIPTSWITAVTQAFEDAAIQNVTICIASGDTGAQSKVGDGKAHVQYPGSDPWVLAVGGTTIGNVVGLTCDEWAWNDSFTFGGFTGTGASGGGISDYFPQPWYQVDANVPVSVNDGHRGRGVPDVSANASPNSGYPIILAGAPSLFPANGTSASAPLWAGLIAVLNAALDESVGFINPVIYALNGTGFRDILPEPGAADNSFAGTTGYAVMPGWDAVTGWGSPRGIALLNALKHFFGPAIAVSLQDDLLFGTVCHGPASRVIHVYNVGNRDLMILSVKRVAGSADFTVLSAPATPLAIAPGAQVDFTVAFNPTSLGVSESATIQIVSNDPVTPVLDLSTSGRGGTGALETIIADSGSFGTCCVGAHRDEPLTLHNNGPCNLSIFTVTSSSPDFIPPSVSSFPLVIAPGGSVAMPIRFQPAAIGAFAASIVVLSNDPAGPKSVPVSGSAPSGKLAVTGSAIFGPVPACCRVEHTISICNVGDCKLEVSSVAFKRKSRHWKLVNNPFPATLHPGTCLGVVIRYIATERLPHSCDLVITSDDPTDPMKTIEVVATTVWEDRCAKCCEDCRKGCCEKRHCDPCHCRRCGGMAAHEEEDDEE
ncbi:MAG TPA: choice-of-anchor D domain-containing protein [Acetobacteraceae bacterium]|nr:choice-of-anchor D domain-containing protein [Acetobacteraceae bacterium]